MTERSAVSRRSRTAVLAGLGVLAALVAVPAPAMAADAVPGRIAFVSDRDGNAEIYAMNADGTAQTRLTDDPAADLHPAWSPDGTRIAFTRYLPATQPDGTVAMVADIHVMNADGTGLRNLTASPTVLEADPTWSPDGTRLAFLRFAGGEFRIWTMSADGTDQAALTTTGGSVGDWHPRWSPDGRRVLFDRVGCTASEPHGIYAVAADGSGTVTTVVPAGNEWLYQPNMTAADRRLAYEHTPGLGGSLIDCLVFIGMLSQEIHGAGMTAYPSDGSVVVVANADGSNPVSFDPGGLLAPGSAVTLAPDGRRLAFASSQQESFADADIRLLDTATGSLTNLTNSPDASDHSPDWQPRACTITGTPGGDFLQGTSVADVICALGGNDVVLGGGGDDVIHGGPGTDVLYGQDGDDTLVGGTGFDVVQGGNGNDTIDTVDGSGGNDVADGGSGTDTCTVDAGPPADFKLSC